jgi:hypothetical protein
MTTPAARQAPALPLRLLTLLTVLVLLAHLWLLQELPLHWRQQTDPGAARQRPLVTRTIEIKPADQPAARPPALRPPPARTAIRRPPPAAPQPQSNQAATLEIQAQPATESIASVGLEPAADSRPTTPEPESPAAPAEAAAAPTATALSIPGSARLTYVMSGRSKGLDYHASAELEWLQDGRTYDAKIVVSALFLGSRTMSSSGRITADGLAPTRFSDKSRGERAAHFEADKGKISFSANTPDAPWLRGAQDRVSVFVQLASLLAGAPANYPPGSTVSLYTAGPTSAGTWTFSVDAEEKLDLPAGAMATLKLTRKPQRDYDQTIEVWLAPSMAYLPVRNRITQNNGDFVDQQLRAFERP